MPVTITTLPADRMPETEVSLRLAFHLLSLPNSGSVAIVAIDGAQIATGQKEIFPIFAFLQEAGWHQEEKTEKSQWQGNYTKNGKTIEITAKPGIGDLTIQVGNKTLRAECKKGPLVKTDSNPEYRLLREGIGQLMTTEVVSDNDVFIVAAPLTDNFRRLAERWRRMPLIVRNKINIVLVARNGIVEGLPALQ